MAKKWTVPKDQTSRGLKEDDAVQILVKDPSKTPEYLVIRGILGQDAKADTWRIYQRYDLSEYYEVAAKDVAYVEPDGRASRVWLTGKPTKRVVVKKKWSDESDFVNGGILTAAGGGGGTGADDDMGPEPTKCSQCTGYTR